MNKKRIPVHVLTGFLGSGKTTFLNALLKTSAFSNTAVIINEFGEAGLDHLLVEKSDDRIIELSNGCLCCTVRGQLVETLEALLERQPERIVIETTGLADPLPVLQAIIHAPFLWEKTAFAGLVTVFDCAGGPQILEKYPEARKQVAMADIICLSKTDTVTASVEKQAISCLKPLNPHVKIFCKQELLNERQLLLDLASNPSVGIPENGHTHQHRHDINRHSDAIRSVTLRHDRPLARDVVEMFLQLLFSAHGRQVLRLKGLVSIDGENGPLLVQGVGTIMNEPRQFEDWPDQDHSTRIVVITENLDPGFVEELFAGFVGNPVIDTPDSEALTNNPLAIAGFKK